MPEDHSMKMDLGEIYKVDPSKITPDISITRYSNMAFIQCMPRDVCIDFLELPGIRKEDRVMVNGTRIYLSHVAALRLAEALTNVINKANDDKGIEPLFLDKK